MTRLHHVKKARKAIKGTDIKKGDSYYWWQFAFRSKQVSKTRPRRSQYMTQSNYLGQIYDIEDDISALTIDNIEEGCLDEFISQIESVIDEAQSSLDNIPDQLKEAPAGATLQEYIENCQQWVDDLQSVDLDGLSEDDFIEEAAEAWGDLSPEEMKRIRKESTAKNKKYDWIENKAKELLDEKKDEILMDIQSKMYPG